MTAFRFNQRRTRRWWYGGGVTLVATLFFVVFFVASSGAIVLGSPSNFESNDGNMTLQTSGNTDWNCFAGNPNSGGFSTAVSSPAGCAVTTGATQVTADQNGEISWVPGQKFDTQCPALSVNNNPPKDEFTNVAAFGDTAANLDEYFYGATIRPNVNGNVSGDVELNQSSGNGTTSSGCRTSGDRLIAYDFLNGGTSLNFHVLTWIISLTDTSGGNNTAGTTGCLVAKAPPCWGAKVITPDSSAFDGEANQSIIPANENGMNNTTLPVNAFAEFGINLSLALGLRGKCIAFPQQVWESRSSGSSFTSNPQDIEISNTQIQNCGTITIIKHTNPRGLNQAFNFHQDVAGTGFPDFTLNDTGNAGPPPTDSAGNTKTFTNVLTGTYHVSEDTLPAGFGFASVSCVSSTGSSTSNGTDDTTHIGSKTLNLAGGGSITCTYTNNQQLGAIKISKISSKAAATALAGAHFRICTNGTDGGAFTTCTAAKTGSDDLNTGTATFVCVDNLAFGDYYVSEKSAPTGYSIDDATVHKVTVDTNAKCSDTTYVGESITFKDTPKTDLTVNATSQVAGGTKSRIACTNNNGGANIGNSPQPADTGSPPVQNFADPVTVTALGLAPGTYTCVVVIDP
jgi:hypothetical protein